MRMANGYGSVHKIGGKKKRRNPWRARVTDRWEYDPEKRRAVQKFRTIGYFAERKEALLALAEYNNAPAAYDSASLTFEDIYRAWSGKKYPKLSIQMQKGYTTCFNNSEPLHKIKMAEIRTEHLDKVMQRLTVGYASQHKIKIFWNQLFEYALQRDYIQKNYAQFVATKDKSTTSGTKQPLSAGTVAELWNHVDTIPYVDTVLIMLYTGMRPSEMLGISPESIHLEERYMIGGIKTKAGIDRVIPIHERIVPLVERVYARGIMPHKPGIDVPAMYAKYIRFWNDIKALGLLEDATPHSCRHTTITLLTEAGVDIRTIKKIVGHSTSDVTERYTKQSIEFLLEAINKLQ